MKLLDLSGKRKAGVKGPNAAAWLASQGIEVPPQPNTWNQSGDGVIGRLAETEFFIEAGPALKEELPAGVYPVPREDACFALSGNDMHEVLLQVCSVDFASTKEKALIMTSMAGVPVLVVPQQSEGQPLVRIWADPTFGPYLWHTLSGIVEEIRGGRQ
ncbi:MAG: methylglutamate dehydrogenase [Betaproteobacteria bacterium]